MQSAPISARQTRTNYRHDLRTLTYVTLDEANGGIISNLNSEGVAVQAVAPLRTQQRVRLRFELRFPRLRVEAHGQVSWASPSGRCGIHFVDLPARTSRQINEWIFSNILESVAHDASHTGSVFVASPISIAREENDREANDREKLTLSASPRPAIRLDASSDTRDGEQIRHGHSESDVEDSVDDLYVQARWLSRPLSARTVTWLVDSLVVLAGVLLFALIFLSIAHELPPWPLALGTASGAAIFVAAAYWTLFASFGGVSVGARLAEIACGWEAEKESEDAAAFR